MYKLLTRRNSNKSLKRANKNKKDEFYIQLTDVENELKHYENQFKDKITSDFIDMLYNLNYSKTQYNKLMKEIKERLFENEK